jgi:choline-sulfatase
MLGLDGLNMGQLEALNPPSYRRLVAEGVRCSDSFASVPLCAPARGAVLTGLDPHVSGQIENHFILHPAIRTQVHRFQDAGWTTALIGKQHSNTEELDGAYGYNSVLSRSSAGFKELVESYVDPSAPATWASPHQAEFDAIEAITGVRFAGKVRHHSKDPDWTLVREAIATIESFAAGDAPFLVNLQLLGPHHPYDMPEQFYFLHAPNEIILGSREGWAESGAGRREMARHRWEELTDLDFQRIIALQYGYVEYVDWLIGHVLDALEALGILDDTLVVLMSDHGEMAGQKGLMLKKSLHDDAARIGFVLRHPPSLSPGTYDGLVGGIDQMATIGGLCGLPPDTDIQGMDLSESIRDGEGGRDSLFSWANFIVRDGLPLATGRCLRTANHKFCDFLPAYYPSGQTAQLFEREDRHEQTNLADLPRFADVKASMEAALAQEILAMPPPTLLEQKG